MLATPSTSKLFQDVHQLFSSVLMVRYARFTTCGLAVRPRAGALSAIKHHTHSWPTARRSRKYTTGRRARIKNDTHESTARPQPDARPHHAKAFLPSGLRACPHPSRLAHCYAGHSSGLLRVPRPPIAKAITTSSQVQRTPRVFSSFSCFPKPRSRQTEPQGKKAPGCIGGSFPAYQKVHAPALQSPSLFGCSCVSEELKSAL